MALARQQWATASWTPSWGDGPAESLSLTDRPSHCHESYVTLQSRSQSGPPGLGPDKAAASPLSRRPSLGLPKRGLPVTLSPLSDSESEAPARLGSVRVTRRSDSWFYLSISLKTFDPGHHKF